LEKTDKNWQKFRTYIMSTYVDYNAKISPLGEI
jgi:hypothetical protein